MNITAISPQVKNKNRVSIFVDSKYSFSLSLNQLLELKIKVGQELTEIELAAFKTASKFDKAYTKVLNFLSLRPHSDQEIKQYLFKQTQSTLNRKGESQAGWSKSLTDKIYQALLDRQLIDDREFAKWWLENRKQKQGLSLARLRQELLQKGVANQIIEQLNMDQYRDEQDELEKVINRKQARYADQQKLIQYLLRQGFRLDQIKSYFQEIN